MAISSQPRRSGASRLVVWLATVVAGLMLLVVLTGFALARFMDAAMDANPPDTLATPSSAAAGASWAGFTDVSGLEVLKLYHEPLRDEVWAIVWRASPESVDRFLASGGFTAQLLRCFEPGIYGLGETKLTGCQGASDHWLQPDGQRIGRNVTRGALPDGTYIVYLEAIEG